MKSSFEESWTQLLTDDVISNTMLFKSPHTPFHWLCPYTEYEFDAPFIDVLWAMYQINRLMALRGYATINDFFDYISQTDYRNCKYDEEGWSIDGVDLYDYQWIDFRCVLEKHSAQFIIEYPIPPHRLDEWMRVSV